MKKNVVIISTSPRRNGNSEMLCKQFEKGAVENGHKVELINVNDYDIKPYVGDGIKVSNQKESTLTKDGKELVDKIIKADVVVFASPIYFFTMTAQLKIIMDIMFDRYAEIKSAEKKKEAYIIITSGSPHLKDANITLETIRRFISYTGMVNKGEVLGLGAFNIDDATKHPAYLESYQAGKNL